MNEQLDFRGQRRDGAGICGRSTDTAEGIVERWWKRGALWLDVEREGELVGCIDHHPDTGRRIWWYETEEAGR